MLMSTCTNVQILLRYPVEHCMEWYLCKDGPSQTSRRRVVRGCLVTHEVAVHHLYTCIWYGESSAVARGCIVFKDRLIYQKLGTHFNIRLWGVAQFFLQYIFAGQSSSFTWIWKGLKDRTSRTETWLLLYVKGVSQHNSKENFPKRLPPCSHQCSESTTIAVRTLA